MKSRIQAVAVLAAAVTALAAAGGATATEIVAARLVFEKSVKMKKLDATLYVPFAPGSGGLHCGVVTRAKGGRIDAGGSFLLRLVGESSQGSETWESGLARATLNGFGEAEFSAEQVAGLAAEADADRADARFYRVDFDGGRGGKVDEVTVDCLLERGDG